MEFVETKKAIFKQCSIRLRIRKEAMGISAKQICPDNDKAIGYVLKCKIVKGKSDYLIQPAVLDEIRIKLRYTDERCVLWGGCEMCDCPSWNECTIHKNEACITWRGDEENDFIDDSECLSCMKKNECDLHKKYNEEKCILWKNFKDNSNLIDEITLMQIFQSLIIDLYTSKKYTDIINDVLCRYVPFARYTAYYNIFFTNKFEAYQLEKHNYFHFNKASLWECIDTYINDATIYIYNLCKDEFRLLFIEFASSILMYKKIDSKLQLWVNKEFIKMLKKYLPNEYDLGLRIRNIIEDDYVNIQLREINNESKEKLDEVTENYISMLENIFLQSYEEIDLSN